ncbi:hypothetical protein [Catelliglobosispora koreensis]|uniref:hypothetical protein n=1 Tax=Catelliglobosispora koreensis TaxID=129052 RepID=UPI00035D9254|nr:hypothetical protein [Catelliglobosispora koreensis]
MQIKKAGVVATGALASVAIMGAPAAAAPSVDASALTQASTLNLARGGWSAPWDQPAQSAISVGTGSVAQAAAWQICGSAAVAGVGITADLISPNTVFGDCNNGNIKLKQDTIPAVISVLNDSALSVATWQACGSTVMGGVGGTVSLLSANTVIGDCKNGNIVITREHGYEESATVGAELVRAATNKVAAAKKDAATDARNAWATRQASAKAPAAPQARNGWSAPWEQEPQSAISVGSGSAATAATWQACGSEAVWGLGAVVSGQSPSTIWGDCDNANVWIDQDDPTAIISVLDNSRLSVADWQVCGSTTVSGVGVTANLGSPNTVYGDCNNANTVID